MVDVWATLTDKVLGHLVTNTEYNELQGNVRFLGSMKACGVALNAMEEGEEIVALPNLFQARLGIDSSDPWGLSSGGTGADSTLYLIPIDGGLISLYNTTLGRWQLYQLNAPISITIAGGSFSPAQIYDIFVYDNGGTLTLENVYWGSTSRGVALATQNGVRVKSGNAARRYVGSIYTASPIAVFSDDVDKRHIWNMYNRIPKRLYKQDIVDYRDVTSTSYTDFNVSVSYLIGVENVCTAEAVAIYGAAATTAPSGVMKIYEGASYDITGYIGATFGQYTAKYSRDQMVAGKIDLNVAGKVNTSGTVRFYGDNGDPEFKSGISGAVWC